MSYFSGHITETINSCREKAKVKFNDASKKAVPPVQTHDNSKKDKNNNNNNNNNNQTPPNHHHAKKPQQIAHYVPRDPNSLLIAMFSNETLHSVAVGGLAQVVTELSCSLTSLGHEVHIFTMYNSYKTHEPEYQVIDGVHYHRCAFRFDSNEITQTRSMVESMVRSALSCEGFMNRAFDVVHAHDWLTFQVFERLKTAAGDGRRRRSIASMHSTVFGRNGNKYYNSDSEKKMLGIERRGCIDADRVICVSENMVHDVKTLYDLTGDNITGIRNGVRTSHFDQNGGGGGPDMGALKLAMGIDVFDPVVLCVCRLTSQKGPDLLLDAVPEILASFPKTKFLFVGDGDLKSSLEDKAHKMGLATAHNKDKDKSHPSKAVRFLGSMRLNSDELVRVFKMADLVAIPSRNEPFGIVALEAMACWKPVVATNQGGLKQIIRDRETGFLECVRARFWRLRGAARL